MNYTNVLWRGVGAICLITCMVYVSFPNAPLQLFCEQRNLKNKDLAPLNFHDSVLRILKHLYPYEPLLPTDYKCDEGLVLKRGFPGCHKARHAMGRYVYQRMNNKTNGFFVECGAVDGVHLSNTVWLEKEHNWTGLLVEVDPFLLPTLKKRNRRSWVADVCLSTEVVPMMINFTVVTGGRTFFPNEVIQTRPEPGIPYLAKCYPLHMLLDVIGVKEVDYLSLDVEGNELGILKTIPRHRIKIKIISVETLTPGVSLRVQKYLERFGYKKFIRMDSKDDDYLEDDVYELVR